MNSPLQPETLHENPWFRIRLVGGFYVLEPCFPQVAVLCKVGEDVVLVQVRRPVLDMVSWELPAGGAEAGESHVEAARRELAEETGVWIDELARFRPLPSLAVSPDRIAHWPSLYRIELSEAEFEGRRPHDDEIADLARFSQAELERSALSGDICSCLTLGVLFRDALETRRTV